MAKGEITYTYKALLFLTSHQKNIYKSIKRYKCLGEYYTHSKTSKSHS